MYDVILTLNSDPLSDAQKTIFANLGCDYVRIIPEMPQKDLLVPLNLLVPNLESLDAVRKTLNAIDTRKAVEIVGVWKVEDGSFLDLDHYPFDLKLYADCIGVPEDDAVTIQVNKFSGMPDRQLA